MTAKEKRQRILARLEIYQGEFVTLVRKGNLAAALAIRERQLTQLDQLEIVLLEMEGKSISAQEKKNLS